MPQRIGIISRVAGVADHGRRIFRKHARHWFEVADVSIHLPKQCGDRGDR